MLFVLVLIHKYEMVPWYFIMRKLVAVDVSVDICALDSCAVNSDSRKLIALVILHIRCMQSVSCSKDIGCS